MMAFFESSEMKKKLRKPRKSKNQEEKCEARNFRILASVLVCGHSDHCEKRRSTTAHETRAGGQID